MQKTSHFKTIIKKKGTMCNNNCSFFCISFKSNQLMVNYLETSTIKRKEKYKIKIMFIFALVSKVID